MYMIIMVWVGKSNTIKIVGVSGREGFDYIYTVL